MFARSECNCSFFIAVTHRTDLLQLRSRLHRHLHTYIIIMYVNTIRKYVVDGCTVRRYEWMDVLYVGMNGWMDVRIDGCMYG